mmetsp:Transcript_3346/g.7413  ORF Transcript_3346/g.7413 Transcript_3346/m.7413 type:complete len:164 (-) Transcript_3346:167-658(-)
MGCSQSSALASTPVVKPQTVYGDITHVPKRKQVTFADLPRLARKGDDEDLPDFRSMESSPMHSSRPSPPSKRLHQKHAAELGRYLLSVDQCPEILQLIVQQMREKEFGSAAAEDSEDEATTKQPLSQSVWSESTGCEARQSRTQSTNFGSESTCSKERVVLRL